PTGSSRADLVPTLALARRISAAKHEAEGPLFALCRVMTPAEAAEARATIGNAGFTTLDGELIERPGYRQAQNVGRSASETGFSSLNTRAKKLAKAILDRLN
ncbi:MAG TPA: ParA family protein, partial [Stellaceae bacterium]|nr:ParA family protein [Stellaceae bacterium]